MTLTFAARQIGSMTYGPESSMVYPNPSNRVTFGHTG